MRLTDPRLVELARVSYLHYRQGKSQKEVAELLGKSNMTVSRLLREARERGVVEFRLRVPYPSNRRVEHEMTTAFPALDDIIVIEAGFVDGPNPKRELGEAAASYVPFFLRGGMSIGIGSGETLGHLAKTITHDRDVDGVEIVQLAGITGHGGTQENAIQIAQQLAANLRASLFLYPLPNPLNQSAGGDASPIDAVRVAALAKWRSLDIGIVGIGSTEDPFTASRAGFVTPLQLEKLRELRAAGDILLHFYDAQGRLVDDAFDRTVSSIPWQLMRDIPVVIAIAGGISKAVAICGALRSGLVDVLITDENTAGAVLDVAKQ